MSCWYLRARGTACDCVMSRGCLTCCCAARLEPRGYMAREFLLHAVSRCLFTWPETLCDKSFAEYSGLLKEINCSIHGEIVHVHIGFISMGYWIRRNWTTRPYDIRCYLSIRYLYSVIGDIVFSAEYKECSTHPSYSQRSFSPDRDSGSMSRPRSTYVSLAFSCRAQVRCTYDNTTTPSREKWRSDSRAAAPISIAFQKAVIVFSGKAAPYPRGQIACDSRLPLTCLAPTHSALLRC